MSSLSAWIHLGLKLQVLSNRNFSCKNKFCSFFFFFPVTHSSRVLPEHNHNVRSEWLSGTHPFEHELLLTDLHLPVSAAWFKGVQ